jgi:hypothetical protein
MEHYVGLDVSLKLTSICVVSDTGSVVQEGVVDSDPEAIAAFVRSKAPKAVRVGLETGPTARCAQARGHHAPHVGRRDRVYLVEEGDCCLASNQKRRLPPPGGKRRPCRDDGDGEFDRFYASVRKADRDCNIELPPSLNAVMRRSSPTAERTVARQG